MELKNCFQFSTILMFGALAVACGSADDPNQNNATTGTPGSSSGSSSSSGGIANECNIDSGFAGDDLCILPPAPGTGFQLHYGPTSYDADAVKPYLLDPGGEMTDCFFVKSPNPDMIFTHEFHGRMRPGSHHMIVYAQSKSVTDGLADCNQGPDARFFVGAQTPKVDVPLPNSQPAPENVGLAMQLDPQTQMAIQLHFINTGTEPILRESWVNVVYTDPADVKTLMEPIFFLGGLGMSIAPNTHTVLKGSGTAPKDLRVLGITGHFHAHTVRFTAWSVLGGVKTLILEDYNWHEPSNLMFDSVTQNPAADPVNKTTGGYSGILNVKAGDSLQWECEVNNDSNVTLTFDNAVYTGEMCNLFGFYAPGMGKPWQAINF